MRVVTDSWRLVGRVLRALHKVRVSADNCIALPISCATQVEQLAAHTVPVQPPSKRPRTRRAGLEVCVTICVLDRKVDRALHGAVGLQCVCCYRHHSVYGRVHGCALWAYVCVMPVQHAHSIFAV